MPDEKDLKEAFKRAAEIAKVVPESMQEAAFHRALDQGLDEGTSSPVGGQRSTRRSRRPGRREQSSPSDDSDAVLRRINRTEHPEISGSAQVLDRALGVLRIAKDLGVDGLTAAQIATVLTDKFRLTTVRQTVTPVLNDAGTMVDRDKVNARRVVFRIMSPGEKYLDAGGGSAKKAETEAKPKPRRRRRSKPKPSSKAKDTQGEKTPARKTGRPGPKPAVQDLIDSGFFSEPRTISEIQDRLRTKRGYLYELGALSPTLGRLLRDGALDRERNEDGHFEYTAN